MCIERTFVDLGNEPDQEHRLLVARMANLHGLTWNDILQSKRVLLVTEAGVGKTYECQRQAKLLWDAGEPAFYLDLAGLKDNTPIGLMSSEEEARFNEWIISQSDVATFFLDSIDELQLTLGKFDAALIQFAKPLAGHLHRIRVVITSRPIPIDEEIFRRRLPIPPSAEARPTSKDFADIVVNRKPKNDKDDIPEWRNVGLMPLSEDQIREMVKHQGVVDVDAFMEDIRRHDAEEFAQRPEDLIELCADFRTRQEIRTRADQIAANIAIKLKPRTDRQEPCELSEIKALDGARRLALALLLHRSQTIRHNAAADKHETTVVALDASRILPDWSAKERSTLLERPLFGFATYGRVRFHHRSIIEYLGAEELFARLERGMPRASVRRLLFAETAQGEIVVRPSMRPVAAWLARQRPEIFEKVRDLDPAVLLDFGDPASLSPQQRIQALRAYVNRYGKGGWRGLSLPYLQVRRFATSELGAEIRQLWIAGVENTEVRQLLLRLIAASKCPEGADLAFAVASDFSGEHIERSLSLDVLIALRDVRLVALCDAVENDRKAWPNELARSAVEELFPEVMSAQQLCRALATIIEPERAVGELTFHLPLKIESAVLSAEQLEVLRSGLSALVVPGIHWNNQYYHPEARRQDLLPMLAAVCIRLWESNNPPDPALIATSVRVLRCASSHDVALEKYKKHLHEKLGQKTPSNRAAVFWEDEWFFGSIYPRPDRENRFYNIAFRGPLKLGIDRDWSWICHALGDTKRSIEQRLLALDTAIHLARQAETSELQHRLVELGKLIGSEEILVDTINSVNREPSAEWLEMNAEQERLQQERQNEEDEAHRSWIKFWQEIRDSPDQLFGDDTAGSTVWNLWRAMSRDGEESRSSGWNRRFMEDHFGADVAHRMRLELMRLWRSDLPTLRSERAADERNTYLIRWQLGLAGIAAESEDPNWVNSLSEVEAQTAARYAPIELNGFPSWLDSLAFAQPSAVDNVLGKELSAELNETINGQPYSILLQNISHASASTVAVFMPRLMEWVRDKVCKVTVSENNDRTVERLSTVLDILIKHGDASVRQDIRDIAVLKLASREGGDSATVWLPALLQLDPGDGVTAFENIIAPLPIAANGEAVTWFSRLFGRNRSVDINFNADGFTPDMVLRLLRLAYTHVRIADDLRHEGLFSPNSRDDAQSGRSSILGALLSFRGEAGWKAKVEMANDPLATHFRDRLIVLAKQASAEDADGDAFTYKQLSDLQHFGEAPPATRDAMFALMRDRLEDLDDLLLQDISPREIMATTTDEHILRRAIAHELQTMANNCYTVEQESVTADEKETDIRLRSTISGQQGTIELKVGEGGWSGIKLRDTLRNQLVERYMAADNCRAGCLLITISTERRWKHPDTERLISFEEMMDCLKGEAAKLVEEYGGAIRLLVKGLNLRPRIS